MTHATNIASRIKRYRFGSIGFEADLKAAALDMAYEATIPETIGPDWFPGEARLILAKLEMAVGSILDPVCRAIIVSASIETLSGRIAGEALS